MVGKEWPPFYHSLMDVALSLWGTVLVVINHKWAKAGPQNLPTPTIRVHTENMHRYFTVKHH